MSEHGEREAGFLVRASDRAWRILVVLALVGVVIGATIVLAPIVVPLLLAVVVVPVGRPFFEQLELRLPSSLAAAVVLLTAVLLLAGAGLIMAASLAANWSELWVGVADAVTVATDWLDNRLGALDDEQLRRADADVRDLTSTVADTLVGGITSSLTVLGSFLVGFVLFLVTFFFGVRDWHRFRAWVIARSASESKPKVELFVDRYSLLLRRYWRAQALVGLFDALAIWLGLTLIGVPLAVPIAVLTFFISFIPYVGAFVSGALAVLVALGSGGGGDAALALVLSLFVFNTGENLIRPWLVQENVHMHTFVAFVAGTTGVMVAGALGAIVAVPVVALVGEGYRIFVADGSSLPAGDEAFDGPAT